MLDPAELGLALPRPLSAGPLVRPALRACLLKDQGDLTPVGQRTRRFRRLPIIHAEPEERSSESTLARS